MHVTCPECGSQDVSIVGGHGPAGAGHRYLVGCADCGHEWGHLVRDEAYTADLFPMMVGRDDPPAVTSGPRDPREPNPFGGTEYGGGDLPDVSALILGCLYFQANVRDQNNVRIP